MQKKQKHTSLFLLRSMGGQAEGLTMRRPGSEDPHRHERKMLFKNNFVSDEYECFFCALKVLKLVTCYKYRLHIADAIYRKSNFKFV